MLELSERRSIIVDALNKAINIFTSHDEKTFEEVMTNGIRPIADAVGLDRVVIYRQLDIDGEKHFGQTYRWVRAEDGLTSLDDELRVLPNIPVLVRWESLLSKGEVIRIRESGMTEDEAAFLRTFGVKSILILPIFTHSEFWGSVAFQDHANDRYFNEDCDDLLYSAARLCANAVIRAEALTALKRREQMTETLNKAAIIFLSQSKAAFGDTMTAGVKLIADMLGLDRISVWRNSSKPDGLHTAQIYRWDRESGGTTTPTPGLEDITYARFAPRWEGLLSNGGFINSPVHLLPEAAMLKAFGVVSVFNTPITINNNFWGFVLFEDRRNERYFEDDSADMMRSAALLCANTVISAEMERDVASANELNRAIINAAPFGITMFDENNQILDCNDVILKTFGASKQHYFDDFAGFSPELQKDGKNSAEKTGEVMSRAINGENLIFEWTHLSINDEHIPFEVTLTRVKHNEKYIGLAFQYDLRRIKKIEEDLAEAEELTRAVAEASPIPYVMFDENLCAIDCNDAAMRVFACPDKKYLLEYYWEVFAPETQADGKGSYRKAKGLKDDAFTGGQSTFEWMHRSLNGEPIPVENTLSRVKHKGKEVIISFKYDLRSTKKMMENIHEQSEQLRIRLEQQELISEISRGFISSGDSDTYVKEAIAKLGHYHNVSLVLIFGIDYERDRIYPAHAWSADGTLPRMVKFDLLSLIKDNFPERLPECSTMPVISCADIAASQNESFQVLLAADVHAFICAPLYVEGRLWGVMSVEQCFTPRKWTDNEKGFVAMTASTIAGVIMRDIYNTMLKEALQKATVASKAKGEFLSNMSHEMRTPLNAIIGMTAIGKNTAELERKNYALKKIEDASTHLLGVINDVLDMSKIEANKLELSFVSFDFEKMLQKVVNVINFRVDEKHQKLMVHIDRNIPKTLIGDDQRLAQVITNLLGNAIKFTPEKGSINLEACLLEEKDGKGTGETEGFTYTIRISVTDTGIGISAEQQKRLFQSFQQAESSTVRKYGGTGLGLSISKNIVEMMGGKIWVESEPGKGSSFIFTIQAKRGEDKKQSLRDRTKDWDEIRILAVDDDPDILEFFRDIAQRYKISCDTALGSEEALRLIEQNGSYNIYFVDWKMPGIDGITLTKTLKTSERNPGNAIVIMISAAEWGEIEEDAKQAGVDRFLPKPLFPSAVADTISECLGVERQQAESVHPDNTGTFAGHRILLAEDVEINREIVLALLESTLLEIDCAENGVQAVSMFANEPEKYEMIFMDVQMPEMDGYDATRRIRALETEWKKSGKLDRQIPIIAMTANVFREDIEKCLEAGMNDHVGKPLDFDIVLDKLHTYLNLTSEKSD